MAAESLLNIDIAARALVQSRFNSGNVKLSFFQGDTVKLVLRGLELDGHGSGGEIYRDATIPYATLRAGIVEIDAAPSGSIFTLIVDGYETEDLGFDVSKLALQSALNALDSVTAAGGLTVENTGATNIYRVQWIEPENAIEIEVGVNKLTPLSMVRIDEDDSIEGKVNIKLLRAPLAYTDEFTLPLPPAPTIAEYRAGSSVRNEVQRLTLPAGAVGAFALRHSGTATTIFPVATVTATQIAAALNGLFPATDAPRFAVTQTPAIGLIDIEFIGALEKANQSLLVIDLYDQTPRDLPTGVLPLTSLAIEDFLDGAKRKNAIFEIVAADGAGKETTLCQQECTIINDGLDAGVASFISEVATRETVTYVYPDPDVDPVAIANLGQAFTVESVHGTTVITHNLGTRKVTAIVLKKTADDPDEWTLIPDDQYQLDVLNENEVKLWFAQEFEAAPDVGSLEIWLTTLAAQPILANHQHDDTAINCTGAEAGKTLPEVLAELRNAMPDGWPNVPANKISGQLAPSQIDLAALAAALQGEAKFLDALKALGGDAGLLDVIAQGLANRTTFLETLKTLMQNADLLTALIESLKTNSTFATMLQAALQAAMAGGSGLNENVTLIPIPKAVLIWPGRFDEDADFAALLEKPLDLPRSPGLVPALHDASAEDVTALPGTMTVGSVYRYTGSANLSLPGGAVNAVKTNGFFGTDGRSFYPLSRNGSTTSYFPRHMEQGLFLFFVNDAMMSLGAVLTLKFRIEMGLLKAATQAQMRMVIETGTATSQSAPSTPATNLEAITWSATPLLDRRVILTPTTVEHHLGCRISRSLADAITAETFQYGKYTSGASAPASANFALRARLIDWDTENAVENARGYAFYNITEARATIVGAI